MALSNSISIIVFRVDFKKFITNHGFVIFHSSNFEVLIWTFSGKTNSPNGIKPNLNLFCQPVLKEFYTFGV